MQETQPDDPMKARIGPRSLFAPGQRLRMNIVPMFLSVFIPWAVFIFCEGITYSWVMHRSPALAYGGVVAVLAVWMMSAGAAAWARKYEPDPTWVTYLSLMVLLAVIFGTTTGTGIYSKYSKQYLEIMDLKVSRNVDVGQVAGRNIMDSGILIFTSGNRYDDRKSWHFMNKGHLYCAAPIVSNDKPPVGMSYDFWAVGKDCCSVSGSDFRCGSWGTARAKSGIRVTNTGDLGFYSLAVQQAESLYNIRAANPIFLTWSADAELEVNSWAQQAFKAFLVSATFGFICFSFAMSMATCRFAWLGRSKSAYTTEFYQDPAWEAGTGIPPSGPEGYAFRNYSA